MMPKPRTRKLQQPVTFAAGEIEHELLARTHGQAQPDVSRTAQRDVTRYYALLRLSLPGFSVAEASLLVDVLNGSLMDPHSAQLLWAEVDDALADGVAEKWRVDGPALVKRLRALSVFEAFAICDAVERFWIASTQFAENEITLSMLLQLEMVGLVNGRRATPALPTAAQTGEGEAVE